MQKYFDYIGFKMIKITKNVRNSSALSSSWVYTLEFEY